MKLIEHLKARGLIQDGTNLDELEELLSREKIHFYCGFDATAPSLQAGNLVPVTVMRWFQLAGHHPIVVLGSATSMIGDPSGKSDERKLLDQSIVESNMVGIGAQLQKLLKADGPNDAEVVRNGDWIGPISFLEFLRDVGKHVSVNTMIAKESVRARLENREQGISFTEFSYMLLQAFDFFWLFTNKKCRLQLGGSDQWGNITAGIDLIRRKAGPDAESAYGLTMPLLMTSAGTKFGKTEQGTIWVDGSRTSPYQFYQFWLNSPDADVIRYLKMFTFLTLEEIAQIESQGRERPEARIPQRRLAEEMTKRIHGEAGLEVALAASNVLFGGSLDKVSKETLLDIFRDVPSTELPQGELASLTISDLLVRAGLCDSKSAARRLIEGGGVSCNAQKVTSPTAVVSAAELLHGELIVLRSGKKNYALIRVA